MHSNPLKPFVLNILTTNLGCVFKEYELFKLLDAELGEWPLQTKDENLNLFRKHFLVMNSLYALQEEYYPLGFSIRISPLHIVMEAIESCERFELSDEIGAHELSQYYLDWKNLVKTNNKEVEALLDSFWNQYYGTSQIIDAFTSLELSSAATWTQVKSRYQKFVQMHHPDKGGRPEQFIKIRQAYELIKRHLNK